METAAVLSCWAGEEGVFYHFIQSSDGIFVRRGCRCGSPLTGPTTVVSQAGFPFCHYQGLNPGDLGASQARSTTTPCGGIHVSIWGPVWLALQARAVEHAPPYLLPADGLDQVSAECAPFLPARVGPDH